MAALLDDEIIIDREPTLDKSLIVVTILNVLCISVTIVWLVKSGLSIELWSLALIILTCWLMTFNCILGARAFVRIREASIMTGKPEEFRDYVVSDKRKICPIAKTCAHSKVANILVFNGAPQVRTPGD